MPRTKQPKPPPKPKAVRGPEFYCGLKPVKGKRLGTDIECYESKKVNYWGVEPVTQDALDNQKWMKEINDLKKQIVKILSLVRVRRSKSTNENHIGTYMNLIKELSVISEHLNGISSGSRKWY